MRKQTALWTCKDKSRVRICDMTDSHLKNTIALLERWASREMLKEINSGYSVLSMLQGEMAQFFCEQDLDRLQDQTQEDWLTDHYPLYPKLLDEAERRQPKKLP